MTEQRLTADIAARVRNLLQTGNVAAALILHAARERRETRAKHIRKDFPFTNPHLNKLLVLRRENGETQVEWRAVRKR